MQNSLRLFFLLAAAAPGALAAAPTAPVPAPATASAADALTRIESETLVLKARERQLAVQAAIMQRQSEIAGRQEEGVRRLSVPVSVNPVVQSLEGIGKQHYATLLFESGAVADVRAGDVLPDGLRVVRIDGDGVTVETANKKRTRLHLAGSAAAPFAAAPSLPPLPPPVLARPAPGLPPLYPGAKGSER